MSGLIESGLRVQECYIPVTPCTTVSKSIIENSTTTVTNTLQIRQVSLCR